MKRSIVTTVIFILALAGTELFSQGSVNRTGRDDGMPTNVGAFARFDDILAIGSPAPDFTLESDKGQSVSLSSLRGKVVVLEFGART